MALPAPQLGLPICMFVLQQEKLGFLLQAQFSFPLQSFMASEFGSVFGESFATPIRLNFLSLRVGLEIGVISMGDPIDFFY